MKTYLIIIALIVSFGVYQYAQADIAGTGMVGWWSLDSNDLVDYVIDLSGSGNHGFMVAAATTTQQIAGKLAQGLTFNGSSQYIRIGSLTTYDNVFASGITMCAWRNAPSVAVFARTVTIEDSTNATQESWLQITNTAKIQFGSGGSGKYKTAATSLVANKWYHLCGVTDYTNGGTVIYLNGKDDNGTINATPVYTADKGNFDIMLLRSAGSNFYGSGMIDDVRLYNRALSANEIAALYYQSAGLYNHGF